MYIKRAINIGHQIVLRVRFGLTLTGDINDDVNGDGEQELYYDDR